MEIIRGMDWSGVRWQGQEVVKKDATLFWCPPKYTNYLLIVVCRPSNWLWDHGPVVVFLVNVFEMTELKNHYFPTIVQDRRYTNDQAMWPSQNTKSPNTQAVDVILTESKVYTV